MQNFDHDLIRIWQEKTTEESMTKNEFLFCHVIRKNTSLVGLPEPSVLWLLVDEVLVSNDQGLSFRSRHQRCSIKKVFLEILKSS